MTRKFLIFIACTTVFATLLLGCGASDQPAPVTPDIDESEIQGEITIIDNSSETQEEIPSAINYSINSGFYDANISVEISSPSSGAIYFTTDGSVPTTSSEKYESSISLDSGSFDFPIAHIIRAICVTDDGQTSDIFTNNYLIGSDIAKRFTTPVLSIWGDSDELFGEPDGLFYGENYKLKGRESEREVYVEGFTQDGSTIFTQSLGARIYGGYSREDSVKSLKFFARDEYGKKKIEFPLFETASADGKTIKKYKKLVLRNAGNDYQFAFFRDELNQILARKAGLCDTEGVYPVVAYLNGSYYGYFWLHENYCDEYFKSKYGDGEGEFVVVEGAEQGIDSDEKYQDIIDEYNDRHYDLFPLDLTDDENYKLVTDFMDVENYLDYYAFNLYIGNWDWPNNNYKCYRYVPAEGEELREAPFDGKWRYLLHDMDYTYYIYEQEQVGHNYNTYANIVTYREDNERYSAMFKKLMQRPDLRKYFLDKLDELGNTVLAPDNWAATMQEVHEWRLPEMTYYYKHLDNLRKAGDDTIWTGEFRLNSDIEDIKEFISKRHIYIKEYIN